MHRIAPMGLHLRCGRGLFAQRPRCIRTSSTRSRLVLQARQQQHSPTGVSRRQCVALLTGGSLAAWQQAEVRAAPVLEEAPSVQQIYAQYPYRSPLDITTYVRDRAPAGDAQAVLDAIDEFSAAYPMYKIGPEKGAILDSLVRLVQPQLVVELGSFVGYSAVRMARLLEPGRGRVVCVEGNPECVAALKGVVEHAGVADRVTVEAGLSGEVVGGLYAKYGQAQLLFEDHCKPCYLPDLKLAESTGLIGPGSWTIADNVVYPGAPDLLSWLGNTEQYAATLVPARYEYDQVWNPNWEPKQDGMSVAVRVEGLDEAQGREAREQLQRYCDALGLPVGLA